MDRLIYFLKYKAKIVAPADNPRIAMQRGSPGNFRRNQQHYPTNNPKNSLPPLNSRTARMNHIKRGLMQSQESIDSQD